MIQRRRADNTRPFEYVDRDQDEPFEQHALSLVKLAPNIVKG